MRARVLAVIVAGAIVMTAVGALFVGIVMAMSSASPTSHPTAPSGEQGPCDKVPTDTAPTCDQGMDTVYIVHCWVLKIACR